MGNCGHDLFPFSKLLEYLNPQNNLYLGWVYDYLLVLAAQSWLKDVDFQSRTDGAALSCSDSHA